MAYEDVQVAIKIGYETAGRIGMDEPDWLRADKALVLYGEDRDSLFRYMVKLLDPSNSDTSDLVSKWKDACEKGRNRLEELERAIPASPNGEGLRGIGLGNFAEGEKKIWEKNKDAIIAYTAAAMGDILSADTTLIQQCSDKLTSVRENDKVVEALIQENFRTMRNTLEDVVRLTATKAVPAVFKVWMQDPSAKAVFTAAAELMNSRLKANLEGAKHKRALKGVMLDNIKVLRETKDQLDDGALKQLYEKGAEFAASLKGTGANGNYDARDWEQFGKDCREPLETRRRNAEEKSNELFNNLLPTLVAENERAFKAFTDDEGTLNDWKNNMEVNCKTMDEAFARGDDLVNELVQGSYREAVDQTFRDIKTLMSESKRQLYEITKTAEDAMKD